MANIRCFLWLAFSFCFISLSPSPVLSMPEPGRQEEAEQAMQAAEELLRQNTSDAQRQALSKLEEALNTWKALSETQKVVETLMKMSFVYSNLGDSSAVLHTYTQALTLIQNDLENPVLEATVLDLMGYAYYETGNIPVAIAHYLQALKLYQTLEKIEEQARVGFLLGMLYSNQGELQSAQNAYTQALAFAESLGDSQLELRLLSALGDIQEQAGAREEALAIYQQVLEKAATENNRTVEAEVLKKMALLVNAQGNRELARDWLHKALTIWQELGEQSNEALVLIALAVLDTGVTGNEQQQLNYLQQALAIFETQQQHGYVATIQQMIGKIYDISGNYAQARHYYQQALDIRQQMQNPVQVASLLNDFGKIYMEEGKYQQALEHYQEALRLQRQVSDRSAEASTLENIATIYHRLGNPSLSIETYTQALNLYQAVSDLRNAASTLNSIAQVYRDAEDPARSLEAYEQALSLERQLNSPFGMALALMGMSVNYAELKDYAASLRIAQEALATLQNQGYDAVTAIIFARIATAYFGLGEVEEAIASYHQGLKLAQNAHHPFAEANLLMGLGSAYYRLEDWEQSLQFYTQELALRRQTGERIKEAESLYKLAQIERHRNNLLTAQSQIQTALTIIEELRSNVASQELRTSFFASKQDYYEFYIDLLMQLHSQNPNGNYAAEAFYTSERARARSLLDLLTQAGTEIYQGVAPQLLEREKSLQQQLDALEKQRVELLSGQYTEAQKNNIEEQRKSLLQQYQDIQTQIRVASPEYAALTQPQPLTLSEVQQQILDSDTLLLQYSLGEERSYLWAVTTEGITSYPLPPRQAIEAAAKQFRNALLHPAYRNIPRRVEAATQHLSQLILEPVSEQLTKKRIVIVGDGILQYIPFGALSHFPTSTPLIHNSEIVYLPSASTLGILREQQSQRSIPSKTVAIFADPVFTATDCRLFDDLNCTESEQFSTRTFPQTEPLLLPDLDIGIWQRLPGTRKEAEAIMALVPDTERIQVFDFSANRAMATHPQLRNYRILHFATHGILNSTNPELSGVVLSLVNEQGAPENGFLRLHDIFNLNLAAELVVLSACETGLGQQVRGEGLVGLARGFMYAGARSVLVSLWNVDDAATAEFMSRFYRLLLQEQLSPTAALRLTQLEMQRETEWKAPYYWAGFTLQGEWR